jgi:hypothetical protein
MVGGLAIAMMVVRFSRRDAAELLDEREPERVG